MSFDYCLLQFHSQDGIHIAPPGSQFRPSTVEENSKQLILRTAWNNQNVWNKKLCWTLKYENTNSVYDVKRLQGSDDSWLENTFQDLEELRQAFTLNVLDFYIGLISGLSQ